MSHNEINWSMVKEAAIVGLRAFLDKLAEGVVKNDPAVAAVTDEPAKKATPVVTNRKVVAWNVSPALEERVLRTLVSSHCDFSLIRNNLAKHNTHDVEMCLDDNAVVAVGGGVETPGVIPTLASVTATLKDDLAAWVVPPLKGVPCRQDFIAMFSKVIATAAKASRPFAAAVPPETILPEPLWIAPENGVVVLFDSGFRVVLSINDVNPLASTLWMPRACFDDTLRMALHATFSVQIGTAKKNGVIRPRQHRLPFSTALAEAAVARLAAKCEAYQIHCNQPTESSDKHWRLNSADHDFLVGCDTDSVWFKDLQDSDAAKFCDLNANFVSSFIEAFASRQIIAMNVPPTLSKKVAKLAQIAANIGGSYGDLNHLEDLAVHTSDKPWSFTCDGLVHYEWSEGTLSALPLTPKEPDFSGTASLLVNLSQKSTVNMATVTKANLRSKHDAINAIRSVVAVAMGDMTLAKPIMICRRDGEVAACVFDTHGHYFLTVSLNDRCEMFCPMEVPANIRHGILLAMGHLYQPPHSYIFKSANGLFLHHQETQALLATVRANSAIGQQVRAIHTDKNDESSPCVYVRFNEGVDTPTKNTLITDIAIAIATQQDADAKAATKPDPLGWPTPEAVPAKAFAWPTRIDVQLTLPKPLNIAGLKDLARRVSAAVGVDAPETLFTRNDGCMYATIVPCRILLDENGVFTFFVHPDKPSPYDTLNESLPKAVEALVRMLAYPWMSQLSCGHVDIKCVNGDASEILDKAKSRLPVIFGVTDQSAAFKDDGVLRVISGVGPIECQILKGNIFRVFVNAANKEDFSSLASLAALAVNGTIQSVVHKAI